MVISNSVRKYMVSVIITAFNRREKVLSALESVFRQTYKDLEIILIDDGSSDKLEIAASKLLQMHPEMIYLKHSNKGTVFSLNTGLRLSTGKFITFLDSDDFYKPNHIELRVKYFEKHKDTDIIHTTAKIIGKEKDMYVPDARDTTKLIHINKCIIGATLFGKRNVFTGLGGFRNIYGYDYDFVKRAKLKFKVGKADLPTYVYHRDSPDSVLTKMKK